MFFEACEVIKKCFRLRNRLIKNFSMLFNGKKFSSLKIFSYFYVFLVKKEAKTLQTKRQLQLLPTCLLSHLLNSLCSAENDSIRALFSWTDKRHNGRKEKKGSEKLVWDGQTSLWFLAHELLANYIRHFGWHEENREWVDFRLFNIFIIFHENAFFISDSWRKEERKKKKKFSQQ